MEYYVGDGLMSINTNAVTRSNQVYSLVKEGLDVASYRSKVISNNMSNLNTKGYKRFYVTFEENLKNVEENSELSMKTTKEKHIQIPLKNTGDIQLEQDKSDSMRNDGNNVDVDNEKVNQAANELAYNTLAGIANMNISMKKYIITEGRR